MVWFTWIPRLTAFSWFHNRPRLMFMFSNVKVYSAPISVGSAPTRMEVFFPGCSFRKATGTGP